MDVSTRAQNRRHRRSKVMLKATLQVDGTPFDVVLRDLSQEGALVHGDVLPEPGTRVLFHRQGLCVPSRVAWTESNCAGLDFDFPLFPKELLRHVPQCSARPQPSQRKARPGLAPKPLSPGERAIIESWATEGVKLGD